MRKIFAKTVNANRTDWSRKLDNALWAYRTIYKTPIASKERIKQRNELDEFRFKAYESSPLYKEKMKKWHDAKILRRKFRVGYWVLLYNSHLQLFLGKIKSIWSGPFRVTRVFTTGAIEVEGQEGPTFKLNGQCLKLYFGECSQISLIQVKDIARGDDAIGDSPKLFSEYDMPFLWNPKKELRF
ncbi:uncharacterized protein LOC125822166 [Solanum verrucosum]|uniref:uncharacterized protein LOC125822166 n=1 Tax=Solanum verrucosum TaxID=315347 RepID=UPI0020D1F0EF|nr:uncharacterized protein LOC125822166 [Solanum verrucosum]